MLEIIGYSFGGIVFFILYVRKYRSVESWEMLDASNMGIFVIPPAMLYTTLFVIYEKMGGGVNFFTVFLLLSSLTLGSYYLIKRFKSRDRTKYRLK